MVSLHEVILYVILMMPVSTLFVNQSVSNKVLFFLSMLALSLVLIRRMTRGALALFFLLIMELAISLGIGGTLSFYNPNDIFYLPQWVLLCTYFASYLEVFCSRTARNFQLLRGSVYLWEIAFLFLRIFSPAMQEDFAHRTASSAFLILVMVWYCGRMSRNTKFYLHMLLPFWAILSLQVRTYFVLSLAVVCMAYYSIFKRKAYFFFTVIPLGVAVLFVLLQTAIGSRFTDLTESYYGGVLATLTSSRSVFWAADLRAFWDASLFYKLFGNGYNFIYDLNNMVVKTPIWGHNDLIHILVTNGLLGVSIYLGAAFGLLRKVVLRFHPDKTLFRLALAALVFCALFDGLYHYTCTLYAVPFLLGACRREEGGLGKK